MSLLPDPEWAPYWHTKRRSQESYGPRVATFASKFMVASKGMRAGDRLDFADHQRWQLDWLLEKNDRGKLRYRQAVLGEPRKTGKSLKGSAIALYFLVGDTGMGRELYSVAGDRQQAKLVFGEARWQVLNNQRLSAELKVYRDAIEHPDTGSVYRVLSSDAKLAQGYNPYFCAFDEVHVQANDELWEAMRQGAGARDESLLLGITTAGDYRDDALLTRLYDYGIAVSESEVDNPAFGFAWWQAPPGCDYRDERMWNIANPNLALGLADMDEMRDTVQSSPEPIVRRYRLNQMVRLGGIAWMDMGAWARQARPGTVVEPGTEIVMAFDGSVTEDATALVCQTMDGHLFVGGCWEKPEGDDDWQVPRDEVEDAVAWLFATYKVRAMQCDTAYWITEFKQWQEKYGKKRVLDFTMSNSRMAPAVQEFYANVLDAKITHADDPRLNRHIANAVTKEVQVAGGSVTIQKQSRGSKHKIDLAVASCMCNDTRLRAPKPRGIAMGFR